MIIQCKQCATKFRFKDELMTGDGVWVRCGRCGHEFFEINTRQDTSAQPAGEAARTKPDAETAPGAGATAPRATPTPKPKPEPAAPPKILTPADVISKPLTPADVISPAAASRPLTPADVISPAAASRPLTPADVISPAGGPPSVPVEEEDVEDEEPEEEPPRASFWTTGRLVAYSILVFLVVGGVYFWLNPNITRDVLNFVYPAAADRVLGPAPAAPVASAGGINFAEVKERFTKSTASGDILIIAGLAVNEYDYPVGRLKLRGKILDNTGKVLGEVETYAGNLLTDDELNRLTDKEVLAELQKPEGSDMPNTNIRPRASIPFMIVFMNPPKEVDEFIIELSGVERAPATN
jgi:predicted Zn finger-like uncharacterized protein